MKRAGIAGISRWPTKNLKMRSWVYNNSLPVVSPAQFMIGDVIVSIGQNSIGISHEIEKISHTFDSIYHPQHLHIDDSSIPLQTRGKSSCHRFHSFQHRASHWYESYHHDSASNLMNTLYTMIESCDNPQTITILYDATTGLGSGLTKYLHDEVSTTLPGLVITSIGILPHFYHGGLNSIHTIMALQSGFEHQSNNFLRCLNDTEYILDSHGIYSHCTTLEPIYALIASDLYYLLPDPLLHNTFTDCIIHTPSSHFRSNSLKDIRSSLWISTIKRFTSHNSKSKRSSEVSDVVNWEKVLRNLSINLHSLHTSSPLFAPASQYSTSIQKSLSISQAIIASYHSGDYLSSTQQPAPAELGRLTKILQGATPGLNWSSSSIPYQSSCQGRKKLIKPELALYFASPYSDHLLEQSYQDAVNCRKYGAYASGYDEDERLAIEGIQEYLYG